MSACDLFCLIIIKIVKLKYLGVDNIEYRYIMELTSIFDIKRVIGLARKKFSTLTEPMFYLLMALETGDMCGIEINEYISKKSKGRVELGPGTLYTLISEFETENVIKYVGLDGKRKIYSITDMGKAMYIEEYRRLKQCISDAESGGVNEQVC